MARDAYHSAVRKALEKENWEITADPLHLEFLDADLWIDLGAEKLIAADRAGPCCSAGCLRNVFSDPIWATCHSAVSTQANRLCG